MIRKNNPSFKKETKLVDFFSKAFHNKFFFENFHENSDFLLHEYDSTYGIADIVIGSFKKSIYNKLKREPININWVNDIYNFKKGSEISFSEYKERFFISETSARQRINEFYKAKFLIKTNKGLFKTVREYKPFIKNIIAIEAKLKDWKKALWQARRYQTFSHLSFVLLDEKYSKQAIKNISEFQIYNIGLITINPENYQVHFSPNKEANNLLRESHYLRVNEAAYTMSKSLSTSCLK